MDCVFCKIINGELNSQIVYKSDEVIAFLDVNPLSEGHLLVVPVKHYKDMLSIPSDIFSKVMIVAQLMAKKLINKLEASGVRIVINNGFTAGQVVNHLHVHVIPVPEGSNIDSLRTHKASSDELIRVMKKLQ